MNRINATCFAVGFVMAVSAAAAKPSSQIVMMDDPIPGQYLVLLSASTAEKLVVGGDGLEAVRTLGSKLADEYGGTILRAYAHSVIGFSIALSEGQAVVLAGDPRIELVVEDSQVTVAANQVGPVSWGLDRIDQRSADLDGQYLYDLDGFGAHVYVIDTGVRSTHLDLAGRVDPAGGFSVVDDGAGTEDCHGHGTFVAAIVAGAEHGVAKGATVHPVRVLDCTGHGSASQLIAGVDWINANHQKPAVVNLSLEVGRNPVLDQAVDASVEAGITWVVAAGNSATDACLRSPGHLPLTITVGATGPADSRAAYSNYGACVTLFAPGESITSAWGSSDTATVVVSGTSAAAPHVAGIAARYLGWRPMAEPMEVRWMLRDASTPAVPADGSGSTSLFAFASLWENGMDLAPYPSFGVACRRGRCTFDGGVSFDDDAIVDYEWDFGDGSAISGKKRVRVGHRYESQGRFRATLTVTDTLGQSSSLAMLLTI